MKNTFALIAVMLFLFSCQKEVSNTLGSTQHPDSTTVKPKLLSSIIFFDSTDTGSINFSYDANNKLINIQNIRKKKLYAGNYTQIVRDDSGFIQEYLQDIGASDSLYSILYHDDVSKKYMYKIQLNTGDIFRVDSTVYTYSGKNITSYIVYETDPSTGIISPLLKREFTYDQNNNTTSDKWYDYNSATKTFVAGEADSYTYDQKMNPLNIGVESIIIDFPGLSGSNNAIKENMATQNTSDTNLITYQYIYNSNNEPQSYTSVASPPGYVTKAQYIYQ